MNGLNPFCFRATAEPQALVEIELFFGLNPFCFRATAELMGLCRAADRYASQSLLLQGYC